MWEHNEESSELGGHAAGAMDQDCIKRQNSLPWTAGWSPQPSRQSSEAGRWTARLQRPLQLTPLFLAFDQHLQTEGRETVEQTNEFMGRKHAATCSLSLRLTDLGSTRPLEGPRGPSLLWISD